MVIRSLFCDDSAEQLKTEVRAFGLASTWLNVFQTSITLRDGAAELKWMVNETMLPGGTVLGIFSSAQEHTEVHRMANISERIFTSMTSG